MPHRRPKRIPIATKAFTENWVRFAICRLPQIGFVSSMHLYNWTNLATGRLDRSPAGRPVRFRKLLDRKPQIEARGKARHPPGSNLHRAAASRIANRARFVLGGDERAETH
jgi:hypothetical protein